MNHTPAQIVRQLLQDADIIDSSGTWPSYVSFFPDLGNEAVCFYDTPGDQDGRMMKTGERIEHDGVQIQVRGRSYNEAWQKANEIALALDAQSKVDVELDSSNTYTLHNLSRSETILPMGVDPNDDHHRHYFAINLNTTIQK